MKHIILLTVTMFALSACESAGHVFGSNDISLCERYGNCEEMCHIYGNCGGSGGSSSSGSAGEE